MSLINLIDAELAFGMFPLLDRANFTLLAGEHVGLIGRNGTGKSSLLQVIAGAQQLDSGEVQRAQSLSVVHVEQEPLLPAALTLRESLAVRGGLDAIEDESAGGSKRDSMNSCIGLDSKAALPISNSPPAESASARRWRWPLRSNRACCC
jgi:ATP-binding cassette subfamily F protein uup